MKQMFVVGHGGPEKLQLRESPEPSPAGGEIRIRVKVSGVNFADILARQGLYPDSPKVPCVVGYEVSGTVDTVGPGVDHAWVGKDVFALTRFGGYSDVVVVPEKQIFAKPASLSHELAAAIPVNYITAWQLLVVMGSLKREETVLVHNVGGGVSDLPRSTSQATSAPRSTERQAVASTPSCYSAACTKPSTTARRTGRSNWSGSPMGKAWRSSPIHWAAITGRRATKRCVRRDGSVCLAFRWQLRRSCLGRYVCCRLRSACRYSIRSR